MVEESVTSVKEILEKLKRGEVNRHYAETEMNHSSSRSHTLFRMTVKAVTNEYIRNFRKTMAQAGGNNNVNNKDLLKSRDGTIVTESFLNFVDLAGSERISVHGDKIKDLEDENEKEHLQQNAKARAKEGKSINKSLFFLTQVISLKAEGKPNTFIPFRNSPLTKILRSSLGGNFRTLVILCVNPSSL
jgi:Kinesin motor domain